MNTQKGKKTKKITIPKRKRGKQSLAAEAVYQAELKAFADDLQQIDSTLPFKVSSRGWCYILEDYGLTKGDFKTAQDLINDCRKTGLLPIHFTADDGGRAFSCIEYIHNHTPLEEAEQNLSYALTAHNHYKPLSFWDYQPFYIELMVEKIDLKSLFHPLCNEFNIPVANAKGWSDINSRAEMIDRFKYWQNKGKQPVLLYCGDHDPAGLNISDSLKKNLDDLEQATGWNTDKLIIDRFGLNYEFIQANNLSWIDNLETGSGNNLADPKHKDHLKSYVQDYIKAYGVRKVEANSLVVRIDAGIALFKSTLDKYLNFEGIERLRLDTESMQYEAGKLVKTKFRELALEGADYE